MQIVRVFWQSLDAISNNSGYQEYRTWQQVARQLKCFLIGRLINKSRRAKIYLRTVAVNTRAMCVVCAVYVYGRENAIK